MKNRIFKIASCLILILTFTATASLITPGKSYAETQVVEDTDQYPASFTSNDQALAAIYLLLDHSDQKFPPCAPAESSKGKKNNFCPLFAKCPEDKPFCLPVDTARDKGSQRKRTLKCACTDTYIAEDAPPAETITGKINASFFLTPGCPVESLKNPCAKRAYTGKVELVAYVDRSLQGIILHSYEAIKDGKLLIDELQPSSEQLTYTLRTYPALPKSAPQETEVTVKPGETVTIEIGVESGIR